MRRVVKTPDELYGLDDRIFEELTAQALEEDGFLVEVTRRTRDGGYDIVASKIDFAGRRLVGVECKRYQKGRNVGSPVIRGLVGVVQIKGFTSGLVATTTEFTKSAILEASARSAQISLRNGTEYLRQLEEIVRRASL